MVTPEAKAFITSLLLKSGPARLSAKDCLKHDWLCKSDKDLEDLSNVKMTNKANLKKFLARRRWQRCGQAIR